MDEIVHVDLPERLDTATVAELFEQIGQNDSAHLRLNGNSVETIGGLCLQMLVAANSEWSNRGLSLRIEHPSEVLRSFLCAVACDQLLCEEPTCP